MDSCTEASGPECTCGLRGCWEALAAGCSMERWYMENGPAKDRNGKVVTARGICELARKGDEFAKQAVEREGTYLGLGLANLIGMFVPDVIVLGGGMMQSADLCMGKLGEGIRSACRFVRGEKAEIALASFGENTNLNG